MEDKKIKKFTAQLFQSVKKGMSLQQIFCKIEQDSNMHSHALKIQIFLDYQDKLSRYEELLKHCLLASPPKSVNVNETENVMLEKKVLEYDGNVDFFQSLIQEINQSSANTKSEND